MMKERKNILAEGFMRVLRVTGILIIWALFLTGCGSRTVNVDMASLKNESGDFQYGNVSWESQKDDVEALMDISLDQSLRSTDQLKSYMTSERTYAWNGVPAAVTCEFDSAGHCTLVRFTFYPQAGKEDAFWEKLTGTLQAQYGTVDPVLQDSYSEQRQAGIRSETYLWQNTGTIHTALSAGKLEAGNHVSSIVMDIYVIP